jgi:hypothetical protein
MEIDLKWASTSISGARPGHSWHFGIIRTIGTFPADKLLNDCKLFSYNQLSRFEQDGSAAVARRVHLAQAPPPGVASMADTKRVSSVPTEELPADILRLASAIRALPAEHTCELIPALERVVESTKRRRRILNMVQDALSQLRLDMKYLMFDVEATRRERDEYHARLQGFES